MSERIDEMKSRIELAEAVESDLNGSSRDGLRLTDIGDYVIVDDGQDRWTAARENFDEALESVIESVLDGSINPDPDEGYQPAYDKLCTACGCLYSNIGSPHDIDSLIDEMESDVIDMLAIFEALGIEDDDLPAMIRVVHAAGERFHGNSAVDIARDWIDNDFDAESAEQWMDAGFWNPSTAAACRDSGMEPSDAEDAAAWLIERDGAEAYTDGSPIYAACNNDLDVQKLIDACKAITAETAAS